MVWRILSFMIFEHFYCCIDIYDVIESCIVLYAMVLIILPLRIWDVFFLITNGSRYL